MAITSNDVTSNTLQTYWGSNVSGYEYTLNDKQVDLQDLLVAISKSRASIVEDEINPLSERIRNRNSKLETLGTVLSDLTEIQASFASDAEGSTLMSTEYYYSSETQQALIDLGYDIPDWCLNSKSEIEGMIQKVKSTIDELNNEAQTDMTRLQSLVDRRDEAYSAATSLMTDVSDSRSNLISNL